MKPVDLVKAPYWTLALATGAKSFADNPILGSQRLNRLGLHRGRIRLAAAMADWRRRFLPIPAEDRAAFARDGFLVKRDFLPADAFARLRAEVFDRDWPALEMRQGPAVTRRINLDRADLADAPGLFGFLADPAILALIRHVASYGGQPIWALQTVIADGVGHDPQSDVHADTFHSTAKAWFFLNDVGPEDGPFAYVPGSHRLTPARLAWEQAQSVTAAASPVRYHARGSFRATAEDLRQMGLPDPVPLCVPANTLVVGDTMGFHARTPSPRPTLRVELYASLRRNPFLPWTGGHVFDLPGIRDRRGAIEIAAGMALGRHGLYRMAWKPVGMLRPDAPARL